MKITLRNCMLASLLVGGGAITSSVVLLAHEDAKGVVKERMEAMERYEELTDRIFAMIHGELPYNADVVRKAATEIKTTSGVHLVRMFPKGSGGKPSEATDAIWQNMDTFEHFAERLQGFASDVESNADKKPDGKVTLPKKWEDVPAMGNMMGRGGGMGQPGMMPGRGMMGGPGGRMTDGIEGAAWRMAHMCNTCHQAFRKEE